MKKISALFIAIVATALFSCVKETTEERNDRVESRPAELVFTPRMDVSVSTKADLIKSEQQFTEAYGECGFHVDVTYFGEDDFAIDPSHFYGSETVRYADGLWQPDNKLFWHEDAVMVAAVGYAPENVPGGVDISYPLCPEDGTPGITVKFTHTIPHDLSSQKDVLFCSGAGEGDGAEKYRIELTFQHPLTALSFKEGNLPEGWHIEKVSLHGAMDVVSLYVFLDGRTPYFVSEHSDTGYDVLLQRGIDFNGTDKPLEDINFFVAPHYDRTFSDLNPFPKDLYYSFTISNGTETRTAKVYMWNEFEIGRAEWFPSCHYTYTIDANLGTEPQYVDLGLSVGWAACNLGATAPEAYGKYYSWGETRDKETYTWATYKWGRMDNMTKYCDTEAKGAVDGKLTLDPDDDAPYALYGGNWRVPSTDNWQELVDNCTWTWTQLNGIPGYLVTSNKTGFQDKSIFLPACGGKGGGDVDPGLVGDGIYGFYWANAVFPGNCSYAACTLIQDGIIAPNIDAGRHGGASIRPVFVY